MAIRFRRSVRIAPGLKLNVGKRSASIRIGGKNLGYTVGTTGRTTSASIPGTGLGVSNTTRRRKGSGSPAFTFLGLIGGALLLLLAIGAILAALHR